MRRSHRGVWKRKAMFYIYSFMYTCTCSGHRKLFTFLQELNAEIKRVEHLLTLRDFAIENLNIELLNLKAGRHDTSPKASPQAIRRQQVRSRVPDDASPSRSGFLQPKWK